MKKLLIGTVASLFLLTGCSNVTNSKELKMGEVFNSGKEHISFILNHSEDTSGGIDKDSYVNYVVISKKGETKFYNMYESELTLGDFAKMDDDEIKEKALKVDKKTFEESKKGILDGLEDEMDDFITKKQKDSIMVAKDKVKGLKYKDPEFKEMKLKVFTDGSGNETDSENFVFYLDNKDAIRKAVGDNLTYIDKDYSRYKLPVSVPKYSFPIYDKKYAGFYSRSKEAYIITEVGEKVETPVLDSKDDKYVDEVD